MSAYRPSAWRSKALYSLTQAWATPGKVARGVVGVDVTANAARRCDDAGMTYLAELWERLDKNPLDEDVQRTL